MFNHIEYGWVLANSFIEYWSRGKPSPPPLECHSLYFAARCTFSIFHAVASNNFHSRCIFSIFTRSHHVFCLLHTQSKPVILCDFDILPTILHPTKRKTSVISHVMPVAHKQFVFQYMHSRYNIEHEIWIFDKTLFLASLAALYLHI